MESGEANTWRKTQVSRDLHSLRCANLAELAELDPDPTTLILAKMVTATSEMELTRDEAEFELPEHLADDVKFSSKNGCVNVIATVAKLTGKTFTRIDTMMFLILQAVAYTITPFCEVLIGGRRDELQKHGKADAAMLLHAGCMIALRSLYPQCHDGDDMVLVPLPAAVANEVVHGLESLAAGEVPAIFQPRATGWHDNPYTWDRLRVRALEHVAFLHGQGIGLGIARNRVGEAMGASGKTLEAWGRDTARLDLDVLDYAHKAGEVVAREAATGCPANSLNAHVLWIITELKAEPLPAFGKRYKAMYGDRHNQ